jgi:two-component SAPR family response regulator
MLMANTAQNPKTVIITDHYLQHEGLKVGEEVDVVFPEVTYPDANGFEIWVQSRHFRNARPIILLPSQYALNQA